MKVVKSRKQRYMEYVNDFYIDNIEEENLLKLYCDLQYEYDCIDMNSEHGFDKKMKLLNSMERVRNQIPAINGKVKYIDKTNLYINSNKEDEYYIYFEEKRFSMKGLPIEKLVEKVENLTKGFDVVVYCSIRDKGLDVIHALRNKKINVKNMMNLVEECKINKDGMYEFSKKAYYGKEN